MVANGLHAQHLAVAPPLDGVPPGLERTDGIRHGMHSPRQS
jgi:hypothetical protein